MGTNRCCGTICFPPLTFPWAGTEKEAKGFPLLLATPKNGKNKINNLQEVGLREMVSRRQFGCKSPQFPLLFLWIITLQNSCRVVILFTPSKRISSLSPKLKVRPSQTKQLLRVTLKPSGKTRPHTCQQQAWTRCCLHS